MALQIRRGTNAERQLIIPLQGELIFTTDTKRLYVGDGTTQGGVAVDLVGGGTGATSITELSDVTITTPSTGQVLKWNGTVWANSADSTGTTINSINDINDVVITTPSSGQVLKYNGTNWVNGTDVTGGTASVAVEDLTNVVITTPSSGQVLKYNGTNWVNGTDLNDGSGVLAVDDLTDVIITTPTAGQVLKFDGTNWVNGTDLNDGVANIAIDDLTDVLIVGPSNGQVLKFNGTSWVNSADNSSINELNDIGDVFITAPTTGDVLKWNGLNWDNGSLPINIELDLSPSLGGNLDLNLFDIIGTGNINITGDVSASSITTTGDVGAGSFTTLGAVDAGSVSATGDVSCTTSTIGSGQITSSPDNTFMFQHTSTSPTVVLIDSKINDRATFKLRRTALTADLSVAQTGFGRILFEKNDINGFTTSSIIQGGSNYLLFAQREPSAGTTFPDAGSIIIKNGTNIGIGTQNPSANAKLEINGIMKLSVQSTVPAVGEAGMVAIANGLTTGWDPAGTNLGIPYPVFHNGTSWRIISLV